MNAAGEAGSAVVQTIDAVRRPQTGRVPPHNLEAEESLLGAMLLSRDAITAAVEARVDVSDFYKPSHGHVYDAIQSLYGQGEPADPVTVAEELRRADLLEFVGGRHALLQIQASTPASANAGHYARIVNELALLRRLIAVAGDISEMGYDSPDDVVEYPRPRRSARVRGRRTTCRRRRWSASTTRSRQRSTISRRATATTSELVGVPTGFIELDAILHGLQRENLVIVAARPGMGKTSLALGMARNVATATGPSGHLLLDGDGHARAHQAVARDGSARSKRRACGRRGLSDGDWSRLGHAVGRLAEAKLFIDDNPHCTVMEMRAKARRMRARYGDLASSSSTTSSS